MSMSTRIEDLPNEVYEMFEQEQMQQIPEMQQMQQMQQRNELEQMDSDSNIKMNVKKRVQFNDTPTIIANKKNDVWSYIKSEVTEENLLIIIMLYIASLNILNKQLRKITVLANTNSDLLINVIKIAVIFIVYVLIKRFVLPKIKL